VLDLEALNGKGFDMHDGQRVTYQRDLIYKVEQVKLEGADATV